MTRRVVCVLVGHGQIRTGVHQLFAIPLSLALTKLTWRDLILISWKIKIRGKFGQVACQFWRMRGERRVAGDPPFHEEQ